MHIYKYMCQTVVAMLPTRHMTHQAWVMTHAPGRYDPRVAGGAFTFYTPVSRAARVAFLQNRLATLSN